jgi:hypothetical protein
MTENRTDADRPDRSQARFRSGAREFTEAKRCRQCQLLPCKPLSAIDSQATFHHDSVDTRDARIPVGPNPFGPGGRNSTLIG